VGILVYMPVLQGILSDRWNSAEEIPQARRRTRHFLAEREAVRHGEPGCESLLFQALKEIRDVAKEVTVSTATLALAWVIAQPGIASAIVGARDPAQLRKNVSAATLNLGDATLDKLDQITRPMKEYFGMNADMWMPAAHSRIR